ncbi:LamG-like jellyroll fold domain-containing protein [Salmonella enterica]
MITNVNGSGSTHYDTIQIDSPESIALEEEYWGFNGNYGNKYYKDHSSCRSVLLYDDIAVWNKSISDSEINTYLSKGTTALALNDPIQYYSCDAADVSITKETSPKIEVSQSQNEYYPELLSDRYGEYYKLCATKNNHIRLNDTICNQFDGNQDFSFGFWFKYSERPTNRTPVAMNIYPENDEHGFSIELYSSGGLHVIAQNDHNYKNLDTAALTTDTWYYVALVWCTSTMVATLYLVEEGSSDINVYETNAVNAGSFTKNGEFCWTLNESGNVNRTWYTTNNDSSVALCFSEPAFWSGLINQNDVALIASLQSSLDDKDSGLSLYPACYFDFNTCPTLMHLSDVRMQRINRMVRLQRWLGLSFEEVDLLINACIRGQGSQNSDNSLNTQTLRMLGVYRHWQQAYQVTAILYQITPYAISPAVPFLDQVFNTASAFDEPFKITDRAFNYTALTGEDGQIVKQICTGLSITRTQFLVLAKQVSDAQNCGANTLICSLDVITALYRLVMTPRWLGLSFEDGVALLMLVEEGKALARLANIPVYTAVENSASDLLDTLMALSDAAQWLADNNLTATWALAMLHDGGKILPATTAELNFVTDINQQLSASLVTETSFNGIASPQLSPLTFSSYSVVTDSPTGNGFQLDSTQNQYAQINGDINQAVDGLENYTIGVWINIPQKLRDITPLLVNATIKDTDHLTTDIGIYLLAKSSNNITPGIHDLNQDGNSGDISFTPGTWFYLAAVMNTENKKFTVYIVDNDTQQLRSKQLNISSVTSVTSGNRWALNQDGALQYYNIYPNRAGTIQYDNLTVWNESLTEDDIKEISASSEVAGGRNDYIATTTLAGNFSWTKCFDDLLDANGLVYPVTPASGESVNSQIEKQVLADIQRWHLPQTPLTHEQIAESATTIIASAKQSQDGIADSALAKAFNIDHSYPPYLLAWAASSEYDLLSQILALNGITTPDTIPDEYQQYLYQIARRAGLCNTFNLTPAMLSTLLAHPAWFGVADTTIDFNLLYLFSRYSDWMKLADKEDAMLAYLRRVNGTPSPTPEQAASCLALLTDWESDEVLQAAAHADPATGIATTLAHIDVVMRLKTLCTHTGTSVETMLNTGDLTTTSTYQEWQSVGESLVATQSNH